EMIRKIIEIDETKCNGCGICISACHENAIGIVNGKAKLLRDDYCDGLGDCLPTCPMKAISFVEREAEAYNEAAVLKAKEQNESSGGCDSVIQKVAKESKLRQWPIQIKLAPIKAPWFDGSKLLIAADCSAYAYANFHQDFINDHITLIGCPKLDMIDYSIKLAEIIQNHEILSISIVKMEVPCCKGIEIAVRMALQKSGKMIPWNVVTITTNGNILERR
ncbi:MAG: 4Fe-4S binding protein, partial [Traorella sp.]